jgi:outer membrane lipoprotein-sorting protein
LTRLLAFACVVAFAPFAAAADAALAPLMQALADVPASEARFTETRTSALLKAPLTVTGRLVWRRPDRLERHVESPMAESSVIEGTRISITRPGDKVARTMAVPQGPAQAMVEALRATLAGDAATLERHFVVRAEGTSAAWTLTLLPRDPTVQAQVTRIDISGAGARPALIDVLEASGDRTVTRLEQGTR